MSKLLPTKIKLGNALIVYSASIMDMGGMVDGMEDCGIDINQLDLLEDLSNIRFIMRDTAPTSESREANLKFMEVRQIKQTHGLWESKGVLRAACVLLMMMGPRTSISLTFKPTCCIIIITTSSGI